MLAFLKNKHLAAAMVIAPVLAIITYLAVDFKVSERPKPAQAGKSYILAVQSNCRYQSGICTLKNNDVEIHLRAQRKLKDVIALQLESENPLNNVLISPFDGVSDIPPKRMQLQADVDTAWHTELVLSDVADIKLRLAVSIAGAHYFAEFPAVFIDYDTGFSRDNFVNVR